MTPSTFVQLPKILIIGACSLALSLPLQLRAGGPIYVGSPTLGVDGQPITWDPAAMPIQYRVDGGPMSANPAGQVVISNATGASRVQSMFQT
jgi:hypothetical protein